MAADDGSATLRAYTDATRAIMRMVARSRHDEQPVFEAILECSRNLCRVDLCSLLMVTEDPNNLLLVAVAGHTLSTFEVGVTTFATDTNQNLAVAYREKRTIHTEDMRDTELYRAGDSTRRMIVDIEGMRSQLVIPLYSGDTSVGVFLLYRRRVEAFTDAEIALLESFADQAVIAIENVRQFRELQTRLEREAATREILSVISQSRDDETPVFDVIVEHAARLCHASRGDLLIASEDKTQYALAASYGDEFGGASFTEMRPLDPERLSARALLENRIYHLHDVREGEAYKAGHPIARTIADVGGIRTILFVPLTVGGEAVGTIGLSRKEVAPFSDDEIALVQSFAAQAVIAIENVRQFRELQTRLEREAATREILYAISQHQDDEQPVFDMLLNSAAKLCGAPNAVLSLVDDAREHYLPRAISGDQYKSETFRVGAKISLARDSVGAVAIRERCVVHENLTDTNLYAERDEYYHRLYDNEG